MNEPKPFASLGPTLLARKGGAKPAMRPQVAPMGMSGGAQAARALAQDFDALEDLGWNDMGEDESPSDRPADVLQLTPAPHNPEAEAETDIGSPKLVLHSADEDEDEEEDEEEAEAEAEVQIQITSTKPRMLSPLPEPEPQIDAGAPKPRVRSIHEELAEMLEKGESTLPLTKTKPQPKPVRLAPAIVEEPQPPLDADDDKANRRAAFTLRLDAKRHLKLRLASTVRNRSAQQLVTEALDRFLKDIPEVELLARNIQHNSRKKV
jgi:hypothetical protein